MMLNMRNSAVDGGGRRMKQERRAPGEDKLEDIANVGVSWAPDGALWSGEFFPSLPSAFHEGGGGDGDGDGVRYRLGGVWDSEKSGDEGSGKMGWKGRKGEDEKKRRQGNGESSAALGILPLAAEAYSRARELSGAGNENVTSGNIAKESSGKGEILTSADDILREEGVGVTLLQGEGWVEGEEEQELVGLGWMSVSTGMGKPDVTGKKKGMLEEHMILEEEGFGDARVRRWMEEQQVEEDVEYHVSLSEW